MIHHTMPVLHYDLQLGITHKSYDQAIIRALFSGSVHATNTTASLASFY